MCRPAGLLNSYLQDVKADPVAQSTGSRTSVLENIGGSANILLTISMQRRQISEKSVVLILVSK